MYHIVMDHRHNSTTLRALPASARRAPSSTHTKIKNPVTEVLSIVVFALSVFTLVALITYNPADPSLFSSVRGVPQNACGRVGAYLAALFLQTLGMGSFLLPAALFFGAATIYKKEGSVRLVGTLGGMAVAVMSLTVFLTLQWKYWPYAGTLMLTGGAFGAWVAELLVRQFNSVGSSIVSLLIFCVAIVLSTPVSVAKMAAHVFAVAGTIGWKLIKILFTYLFYLIGLVAMRTAHAAGDLLQRLMESAIRRARERAQALGEARRQAKAEMKAVATGAVSAAELVKIPEQESEAEAEAGSEGESEAVSVSDYGEAPNALPELETNSAGQTEMPLSEPSSDAKAQGMPTILPREGTQEEEPQSDSKASAIGAKVASKLARFAQRTAKRGLWKLPLIEFLVKPPRIESQIDKHKLYENSKILKQKFADFGIDGEVTAVRPGPVITLYEFKPGAGIKVSRIASLADDLSMALSAQSVRILAPLPGKSVVGIEIPSEHREKVYLREFLTNDDFHGQKHNIPIVMGKDISGQTYLSDLYRMPHLLCAGQTGAGKSVFMNGLICSLLYRFTPDEMRMILVDPKFIEFRSYQDIPHLLLPVVDDPKHASIALRWAVREMERRYRILARIGAKNLAQFNQKVEEMGSDVVRDLLFAEENQGETVTSTTGSDWIEAFEPDETGAPRVGKLPYIVIIIDELADLMMVARKEVEISIARLAQKARASGLHLVVATQRPSTDVITGLIKANLPSRVSFQLASYVDSKTILDRSGAERLLGQGDMLFIPPGINQPVRLHGAFVDDEEIGKITAFLKSQGKPAYREEILLAGDDDEDAGGEDDDESGDELFEQGVELVKRSGHASASFLQRHLKIGYNRAARMIENMESRGIVGPADGARPREVLMR